MTAFENEGNLNFINEFLFQNFFRKIQNLSYLKIELSLVDRFDKNTVYFWKFNGYYSVF